MIVGAIQEGYGEVGKAYRKTLTRMLDKLNRPQDVYKLYSDYIDAMEHEMLKS